MGQHGEYDDNEQYNQPYDEYEEHTNENIQNSESESYELEDDEPEPSTDLISSSFKSDDVMSLPEDMPPAPPPNLREIKMNASKESNDEFEARKSRKSQQFGFRRSSEKPKSPSVQITVPSFKNQKRNSLAIRVRSGSGKEQTLVNYVAPTINEDEEDLSGQDNVNPLAFAMQKEKKRKKKTILKKMEKKKKKKKKKKS